MNFNENVDKDFVDLVLESSLWSKANIEVAKRGSVNEAQDSSNEGDIGNIAEYENGVANEYEEPTDFDTATELDTEEDVIFTLDDLQTVLDNLGDEDLMEHALSMLDVFDVAYENLNEEEDEDEDEEQEEEEQEKEA